MRTSIKSRRYKVNELSILLGLVSLIAIAAAAIILSVRAKQESRIGSKAYQLRPNQKLFIDWPITNPDDVNISTNLNGTTTLILIRGNQYWAKSTSSNSWSSGILFKEGSTVTTLPTSLDGFAAYYNNSSPVQLAVKDFNWYYHVNGTKWDTVGSLYKGETIGGSCTIPLPSSGIDTITVYSENGANIQVMTKNNIYYTKPLSSKVYTACGTLLPQLPSNTPISGHSIFMYNGKLAEFILVGDQYWFYPDKTKKSASDTHIGRINHIDGYSNVSTVITKPISPYIFGANLIWHDPFNPLTNSTIRSNFIKQLKDMGVTILRFPGGCGGDSFDSSKTVTSSTTIDMKSNPVTGSSFLDYLKLIKETGIEPFLTLNLEGEGNHANTNCHGLKDYPGTISETVRLLTYAKTNTEAPVNINHIELGNEPWAGLSTGLVNFTETWTPEEFGKVQTAAIPLIRAINPSIKFTSSWPASVLSTSVASTLLPQVYGLTYHSYVHAGYPEGTDNPLKMVDYLKSKGKLKLAQSETANNGKKIAVTEYNTWCWDSVVRADGSVDYPINPYAQKSYHAIYQTQMLQAMADIGAEYGMTWTVYDGPKSTWKCGLMKGDVNGNVVPTAAGIAFKYTRQFLGGKLYTQIDAPEGLEVHASTTDNVIKYIYTNPTSQTYAITPKKDNLNITIGYQVKLITAADMVTPKVEIVTNPSSMDNSFTL